MNARIRSVDRHTVGQFTIKRLIPVEGDPEYDVKLDWAEILLTMGESHTDARKRVFEYIGELLDVIVELDRLAADARKQ